MSVGGCGDSPQSESPSEVVSCWPCHHGPFPRPWDVPTAQMWSRAPHCHDQAPVTAVTSSAPFSAPSATQLWAQATLMSSLSSAGDIGGQMGLFIGASILTVLELFDYAYEVSVSSTPRLCSCGTRGRATHEPHGAETWLWQVIKHRLCRRGKCRKNHKRNNTDKGVALSMDDVKRHVSVGHSRVLSCLSPPVCLPLFVPSCLSPPAAQGLPRRFCGVGSHGSGELLRKEQRAQAEML